MEESRIALWVIVAICCYFIVLLDDSIDLIRRVHLYSLPLFLLSLFTIFRLFFADLALHYLRQSRQYGHAFFNAHDTLDEFLLHLDHSLSHLFHFLGVQQD